MSSPTRSGRERPRVTGLRAGRKTSRCRSQGVSDWRDAKSLQSLMPKKFAQRPLLGRVQCDKRSRAAEIAIPISLDGHSYQRQAEDRFVERGLAMPEDVIGARATNCDSRPQNLIPRSCEGARSKFAGRRKSMAAIVDAQRHPAAPISLFSAGVGTSANCKSRSSRIRDISSRSACLIAGVMNLVRTSRSLRLRLSIAATWTPDSICPFRQPIAKISAKDRLGKTLPTR